jgi:CelD/BcsL family acetyltransferase involved in cellulose biosynthesis
MEVKRFSSLDELAPWAGDWDRLARGVPFRGWAWASTWWRHYGPPAGAKIAGRRLFVLGVFGPGGRMAGLAPWFVERSAARGRVVRFLGSGEVASDYLSLPAMPGDETAVAGAIAGWLAQENAAWDLLELDGADAEDAAVARLAEALETLGQTVHRRPGPRCWRIELPASWDDYLARLSKDHRKQLRRLDRSFLASGRAAWHRVLGEKDLARSFEVLVDLHRRRNESLGRPGCFASARFDAFHREAAGELLRAGQLRLHWMEVDSRPVAAEYQLSGDGVVYAYQSGVDPDVLECSPGKLITIASIRSAIEEGFGGFDFLRGDEPYKPHLRAEPRPSVEIRVAASRPSARLRHGMWVAGSRVKRWVKQTAGRLGRENKPQRADAGSERKTADR